MLKKRPPDVAFHLKVFQNALGGVHGRLAPRPAGGRTWPFWSSSARARRSRSMSSGRRSVARVVTRRTPEQFMAGPLRLSSWRHHVSSSPDLIAPLRSVRQINGQRRRPGLGPSPTRILPRIIPPRVARAELLDDDDDDSLTTAAALS